MRYVKVIGERYRGKVTHWLTFNEIDCLELSAWSGAGVAKMDPQTIADVSKHQLLASAKTVKVLHEIDPENKVGNMVSFTVFYAHTCHPADVLKSWEKLNGTYFYADVQSRGYYPSFKLQEYKRNGIRFSLTEEEKACLREGTVDFISFEIS